LAGIVTPPQVTRANSVRGTGPVSGAPGVSQPCCPALVSSKRIGEDEKPLGNVIVSVKILGTTFRPLIFSIKTQRDGTAEISTEIPHFTSGRAAVLIRAVALGNAAELRRVIHPSK